MVKITPILRDLLRNQWLNKKFISPLTNKHLYLLWGIERSGFFNGREKWAKGFENQRV